MRGLIIALIAGLAFSVGFFIRDLTTARAPGPDWVMIYENDADGEPRAGSKQALIAAVRSGTPIRVYWGSGRVEHTADAVFTTLFNDEVFAQLPRIRGQRPSRPNEPTAIELSDGEWTAILSTQGGFAVRWFVKA